MKRAQEWATGNLMRRVTYDFSGAVAGTSQAHSFCLIDFSGHMSTTGRGSGATEDEAFDRALQDFAYWEKWAADYYARKLSATERAELEAASSVECAASNHDRAPDAEVGA